jgi:hypothetical protein
MTDDESDEAPKPRVPNPLLKKVRKVSGDIGELGTTGAGGAPGSKPTDFRWAMDRDLDKLTDVVAGHWENEARRPQVVDGFKTIVWNLKRRADRSGYLLLSEVCVLFMDYLSRVPYGDQDRKVIQNYLDAVMVISKKNLIGRGGSIGEEMIAELTNVNRRAGVAAQPT